VFRFCNLAIAVILILTSAHLCSAQQAKHERIEWSDIWIDNANNDDQPRVLLVGDSIVKGYFSFVENQLSGLASCARYATSKFLGNPDYQAELRLILKRYKFDVIHINNGLHGWDYTEKEYKEGLDSLITNLERHASKSKLIWCMTTPVRIKNDLSQFNNSKNNRVIERNRIANEIMSHYDIPINNLYEVVKDHPEYFAIDGVHFNNEGKSVQSDRVAKVIISILSNEPGKEDFK